MRTDRLRRGVLFCALWTGLCLAGPAAARTDAPVPTPGLPPGPTPAPVPSPTPGRTPGPTPGPGPGLAPTAAPVAAGTSLTADYALSSHGLRLVELQTRTRLTATGYAISARTRTVGLVGLLSRSDVTSTATGRFDGDRVLPDSFRSAGRSRGSEREVRIAYAGGDPVVSVLSPPEPDREPVTPSQSRGGIDTLGAIVTLSRLVGRTGACDGDALVFDGRRLSRLEVHTAGRELLAAGEGGTFSGPALRCDFTSRQLGGFLRDDTRARRLRPLHGSAWLAAPVPGAPVAAVRAVFESPLFGRATLRLESADGSPSAP